MKLIVAGSRDFNDYGLLKGHVDLFLKDVPEGELIEIVSGRARGADLLGERYANEKGYYIAKFPADWDKHGKVAGIYRNVAMVEYSDALICFWDGESRGSKHIIQTARRYKLKVVIVDFDKMALG